MLPPKLSTLDYAVKLNQPNCLSNTLIIACQHLLETTRSLFHSFYDLGLSPKDIFVIGKCYSSNPSVISEIRGDGSYVCPSSLTYDSYQSYDEYFRSNVFDFYSRILREVALDSYERIIILDDGGELIAYANSYLTSYRNLVCVEQTSAGYEKLKKLELKFPVINVARSYAKLMHESPNIAEWSADQALGLIRETGVPIREVLIIGNGAIGLAMRKKLEAEAYKVTSYDLNSEKSEICNEQLDSVLSRSDAIFGCTGTSSISLEQLQQIKPGCILASVSSSDREFPAVHIRRESTKTNDPHRNHRGRHWLMNGGFPITFTGARNAVPAEQIQLTRALLLGGVCQATKASGTIGLQELDQTIQWRLIEHFECLSGKQVENSEFHFMQGSDFAGQQFLRFEAA